MDVERISENRSKVSVTYDYPSISKKGDDYVKSMDESYDDYIGHWKEAIDEFLASQD